MSAAGRGRLLAFEGVDGSGKTTQARRYVERRRAGGAGVDLVREPGGTELGERVRELLLEGPSMGSEAETLLYMAARAELFGSRVEPALARGETVVLDRSHYSTAAYQGGGLGMSIPFILECARFAMGACVVDRVVLIDVPVETAIARRPAGGDRIERRAREYFERVRACYLELARAEPEVFRVVDGTGEQEAVAALVEEALADVG